jgi:hypothetical protein
MRRHEAKFKSGKIKLASAIILLISSFIFSVVNFHANEPFEIVMYGFTSAGVVLLIWGLYDILN